MSPLRAPHVPPLRHRGRVFGGIASTFSGAASPLADAANTLTWADHTATYTRPAASTSRAAARSPRPVRGPLMRTVGATFPRAPGARRRAQRTPGSGVDPPVTAEAISTAEGQFHRPVAGPLITRVGVALPRAVREKISTSPPTPGIRAISPDGEMAIAVHCPGAATSGGLARVAPRGYTLTTVSTSFGPLTARRGGPLHRSRARQGLRRTRRASAPAPAGRSRVHRARRHGRSSGSSPAARTSCRPARPRAPREC